MVELSACVAQHKDALVINREKEVSSIISAHVWYHVSKCTILAVKCRVYATNCTELVVKRSVNVPNKIVLAVQVQGLRVMSSHRRTRPTTVNTQEEAISEYPPAKKRCSRIEVAVKESRDKVMDSNDGDVILFLPIFTNYLHYVK